MAALALCGLLLLAAVGGVVWFWLDERLRAEITRVQSARAVRVIAVAPALGGPYRTGGGSAIRVDETNAVLARLRRQRRLIRYAFGLPAVAMLLAIAFVTDGAPLELLAAVDWTDDDLRRS
jgi:hypothetical protein